jgi:hypothetical protein
MSHGREIQLMVPLSVARAEGAVARGACSSQPHIKTTATLFI